MPNDELAVQYGAPVDPAIFDAIAADMAPQAANANVPPAPPPAAAAAPQRIPAEMLIAMMEHGIMGQEGFLQGLGVPVGQMAHFHLSRAAVLIATFDNPVARQQMTDRTVQTFARMVNEHYMRIHTSAGGIIRPPGNLPG